jgi:septum formation protein
MRIPEAQPAGGIEGHRNRAVFLAWKCRPGGRQLAERVFGTAGEGFQFALFQGGDRVTRMKIQISGRLILASASPRRGEFLKTMGLEFDIVPGNIDETFRSAETPREHVLRLSEAKAISVARFHPDAWVLGADTIVLAAGELLGKPASRAEAAKMLEKLSGREHEVLTGFSLVRLDRGVCIREAVASSVFFREIAGEEMAWYTETGEPYDKAGAYAVQGMGGCFVREIRGSCSNVVGLPLCEVVEALKRTGAIRFSQ